MATIYYTATSLDGYLADPDDSLEWLFRVEREWTGDSGDGPPAVEPESASYEEFIAGVGALAMGATTYEWILKNHIAGGAEWPYSQPTWVFTHRELEVAPGADIHFVEGDVAPVHGEMTRVAADGNVWIVGGGELAGRFHDAGLLDEIVATIAPVTLGAGAPLLPRTISDPPMRLVSVQQAGPFIEARFAISRPSS